MKRTAPKLLVAALFAVLAAHTTAAAKETWTSVRSQNFHLVGNASEKDIRLVATRLEQFRLAFSRIFKRARLSDAVPTTVVVFKNESSYKPFNPRNSAGYFQPGPDVNYITLTAELRNALNDPLAVIFHEYTHLLVKNNVSPHTPAWLNEGLAEFYSTLAVTQDGKQADVGRHIDHHVLYLREQKMLPLRTLFAVDHSSPHYNEQSKRGVFYAQSWALVHYLMFDNEKRRQQLNQYLTLVARGAGQQQSFETAFGPDIEAIEKELRDYIRRNRYVYVPVPFEQKIEFDATMQTSVLTEAQALAYLGDLALHSPYLRDSAENYLLKSAALDAANPMAQASLGMLRMRQRRFAEAKEHLRRAVAADARSHLAHYYYAYTLSREGMGELGMVSSYAPETAAEMRAALKRAAELKPDFAGTYSLLAFVNMVTGEQIDESVDLLKRAIMLAPGEEQLRFDLAQLLMRQQSFDSARTIVEPLAQSADPQVKANAQRLLDSIKGIQEQAARFNSQRDTTPQTGGGGGGEDPPRPRLGRREQSPAASSGQTDEAGTGDTTSGPSTVGMTQEEAVALAIREALRKPQPGETRARGVLTRVECGQKGAVFHVTVGAQVLKLSAGDMSGVHFMAYTQTEAGAEIGCGPRKPESQVVIIYRPNAKGGDLVSVEFVPAGFTLEK